jgi:two-component sensor histidine kinase
LTVRVVNDGRGLEAGFELSDASGLGLSIVRTLVSTELAGSMQMRRATAADGAVVGLSRLDGERGTYVELTVPVAS